MKRLRSVIRSPWFPIGVGVIDIVVGVVELAVLRHRSRAWDEAISSEEAKADVGKQES